MTTISQREARALKRRVKELEAELQRFRSAIGGTYPGVYLFTLDIHETTHAYATAAARMGHVLVARKTYNDTQLAFYAVPTEVKRNV